jgi:hypothetical protein
MRPSRFLQQTTPQAAGKPSREPADQVTLNLQKAC